ncbi:MAG: His-Xaa-Ser system protein HxsD [Christensenellales bacterium]
MEERTTRLELDKALYDRRALLKAVYRFTDRAYIHLSQNENQWLVSWRAKEGKQVDTGELENELITQTLRLQLLEESGDLRKILLARAMASTVIEEKTVGSEPEEDACEEPDILRGWFDGRT